MKKQRRDLNRNREEPRGNVLYSVPKAARGGDGLLRRHRGRPPAPFASPRRPRSLHLREAESPAGNGEAATPVQHDLVP